MGSKFDNIFWPYPFNGTGKPFTIIVQGEIPFRGTQKVYQQSYSMTKQQIKNLMLDMIVEEKSGQEEADFVLDNLYERISKL